MSKLNISPFVTDLIIFAVIAVIIYLLFRFASKFVNSFITGSRLKWKLRTIIYLVQFIVWLAFLLIVFNSAALKDWIINPVFIVATGLILLLIVLTIGKDVFTGMAMRLEETLTLNNTIKSSVASGRIIQLGLRSVTLESGNGETIRLPYSKLTNSVITYSRPESKFRSFETELTISRKHTPEETKQILARELLNSPYCSVKQSPIITFLGAVDDYYKFKLSVSVMSEDYFNRLLYNLRKKIN